MTKTTHAAVAPRLPATSVDFNALDKACKAGDDAAQAFGEKILAEHRARPVAKASPETPAAAPAAPSASNSDQTA